MYHMQHTTKCQKSEVHDILIRKNIFAVLPGGFQRIHGVRSSFFENKCLSIHIGDDVVAGTGSTVGHIQFTV